MFGHALGRWSLDAAKIDTNTRARTDCALRRGGPRRGLQMELVVEEGPAGVTQAALIGRMDIEGAQAVEGCTSNLLAVLSRV